MPAQYAGTKTAAVDRNLWRTPRDLYFTLDKEFHFTCDVAANDDNHLTTPYITEAQNALDPETLWGEVNWCNPPYSKIDPWVARAREEAEKGNTTVMLVPADTSTKWFKSAFKSASEIRFISGRIAFIHNATGEKVSGNNKGSVVFVWRGHYGGTRSVSLIDRDLFQL